MTPGAWDSARAYTPSVLYDSDRFSGHGDNCRFKMWYSGEDDAGDFHLGYLGRRVATLAVDLGPACPEGTTAPAGSRSAVLMQLVIDNDDVERVFLRDLLVTLSGSALDGGYVSALDLYRDDDPDGSPGDGDLLLASTSSPGAGVLFSGLDQEIPESSSIFLLVVARFGEPAPQGVDIMASVADASGVDGEGVDSRDLVVSMDAPLDGPLIAFVGDDGSDEEAAAVVEDGGDGGDDGDDGYGDNDSVVGAVSAFPLNGGGGCSLVEAGRMGLSSSLAAFAVSLLVLVVRRR
jgi:hypothetical protein